MKTSTGRSPAALLGLLAFATFALPASATTTTWQFTATVRDFYGAGGGGLGPFPAEFVASGIDVGTPVTGHLVMDDSLADVVPGDATTGKYDGSVLGGSFQLGDLSLSLNQAGGLTTALDRHALGSPPEGTSLYRVFTAPGGIDSTGSSLVATVLGIDLVDSGQDVITSEAFPMAPPNLTDLDAYSQSGAFITSVQIIVEHSAGIGLVYAEITGLTVPEPATGVLVGLGLGIIAWRGRRRAC